MQVDKGTVVLPGTDDETYTAGFDGLDKRCADYYAAGARFAKWRAVYRITDSLPSQLCIHANAEGLAAYAAHCQRNGLVCSFLPLFFVSFLLNHIRLYVSLNISAVSLHHFSPISCLLYFILCIFFLNMCVIFLFVGSHC